MYEINDLLGFGKALEKILDILCKGCRWIAEPYQFKRIEAARRECRELEFNQNVKLQLKQAIVDNAVCDFKSVRHRRQLDNITDILAMTMQDLASVESVSSEPVDADWASRFFDYAQDCSDEKIQILWAKILAGETASPGSYFKRTLTVLREIEMVEAQWFVDICPYIYDYTVCNRLFLENIFPYSEMLSLMDCGLFNHSLSGNHYIKGKRLIISGKSLYLEGPVLERDITLLNGSSLTDAGIQIYGVIQAESNPVVLSWIQEDIKRQYGIDSCIKSYQ